MTEHNHEHHHIDKNNNLKEYLKFAGVMLFILAISAVISAKSSLVFLDSFMGVFFVVFAAFKLLNLKEFAYGFQSYDLIANKSLAYSYYYPFLQMSIGLLYLLKLGNIWLDLLVVIISLISGAGVIRALGTKAKVHCVCLGNVIKLPLSTISFVEDFGMALMAFAMLFMR